MMENEIALPAIDSHTIVSVDWKTGKFTDYAGIVSWQQKGSLGSIVKDNTFGYVFQGNSSCYWIGNIAGRVSNKYNDLTLEFWGKYNSGASANVSFVGIANGSNADSSYGAVGVVANGNGTSTRFHRPNLLIKDTTPSSGVWHHFALTIKGKREHCAFLDGKKISTTLSDSYQTLSSSLTIGASGWVKEMSNAMSIANVRLSDNVRYTADFDPKKIYVDSRDPHTLALLHLDNNLTNSGSKKAVFATDYGSPAFQTTSKFGSASLHFDGKSSIACPYGASGLTLGSQFTIDFWAKYDEWQSYSCLFTIGTTGNTNAICLFSWNSDSTSTEYYFGTYGVAGNSFRQNMDKNWHHFAVVYDNEYYNLYIDGKKKVDKFHYKFNPQSNYKIRFGGSIGGANEFWLKGFMDEIRISDCVRWTADFTPPTAPYEADPFILLKSNYGENLHTRKEGKLIDLPTPNLNEYETAYNEHRINLLIEHPEDIFSWIPCQEDDKDVFSNMYWLREGDVQFLTDETKKPGDIGYHYFHMDGTHGVNSYMIALNDDSVGAENPHLPPDYCVEYWFRMPSDGAKSYLILGSSCFNIAGTPSNGEAHIKITKNPNNKEFCEKVPDSFNRDVGDYSLDAWHHFFLYCVGKRFRFAIDGKWCGSEVEVLEGKTWIGNINDWNDPNPGGGMPKLDICNIVVRKTARPLAINMSDKGFRPPMYPYPYILKDNKIYEHRFVPLMQDLTDRNLGVRIGEEVFADDPFIDVDNLEPKSKLMHVKNMNGVPTDITGKTTWTVTNIFPTDGYYGASLSTYTSGKYGRIVKSGGPDIIVGQSDFTFLMDFMLTKENTYKNASGTTQKWEYAHFFVSGEANSLQVAVENPGNVYWGPCSASSGWHGTATGFVKVGRRYRLVIQRKNGIDNVWLNGIRVLKDIVDTNNYSGKDTWICGSTGTERITMLGNFNNCILWNKAIIPADSSIEKINGIYCTKKTWRLEAKDALLDGDIEKGATQWQFVLK